MIRRLLIAIAVALFAPPGAAAVPDSAVTVYPWSEAVAWDIALARDDEPGPRLEMSGHVFNADSTPAAGVTLYTYHADTKGRYARAGQRFNRLAGVLRTGRDGAYRIRTIMPGMYEGPGHVHYEVWERGRPQRSTWVSLYAAPGVPPVPGWPHTSSATREWKSTMGLFTVDSAGSYHCHKDLYLGDMRAVSATYDSLMQARRREAERARRR